MSADMANIVTLDTKLSKLVMDTMSDMGKLDPDDTRPPYVQVAEAIRTDIAGGVIEPGAKLPSHQAIAEQYGVSIGTVKRALGELQGGGLVVSRQGQGAFVRTQLPGTATAASTELDELRNALAAVMTRLDAVEREVARLAGGSGGADAS